MTDKTGGAAFPVAYNSETQDAKFGMTLRAYFAAKAMAGILVNTERNEFSFSETDKIASKAYELADAMLKARG
ncbi:hypothetical protein [Providencia stuartii]|uniref:hypothetical protein n=1 Tax=Providencia stuartii TaxID=588 RepID=UPI00146B6E93|nr:hypothetical protein [Providencia stuartii]NMT47713.1 hypothetical protein [Providencia stuartii]